MGKPVIPRFFGGVHDEHAKLSMILSWVGGGLFVRSNFGLLCAVGEILVVREWVVEAFMVRWGPHSRELRCGFELFQLLTYGRN